MVLDSKFDLIYKTNKQTVVTFLTPLAAIYSACFIIHMYANKSIFIFYFFGDSETLEEKLINSSSIPWLVLMFHLVSPLQIL